MTARDPDHPRPGQGERAGAEPGRVLLLRHTAVAPSWRGRCYGRHDVPLGEEGRRAARLLAAPLLAAPLLTAGVPGHFDHVVASPLRRARWLGALLARALARPLRIEPLLAERSFGRWEARPWDDIWAAEGNAMDGILDAPDRFRPGGGETTSELARRALAWFGSIPPGASVIAATHGGPIGALAGQLLGLPPRAWLAHVPREGRGLLIERHPGCPPTLTPWTPPLASPARRP